MDRKEIRAIARQIAKAEEKKDYKKIEKLASQIKLLEDMMRIDDEVQKIIS